jgi:hypothetical protein
MHSAPATSQLDLPTGPRFRGQGRAHYFVRISVSGPAIENLIEVAAKMEKVLIEAITSTIAERSRRVGRTKMAIQPARMRSHEDWAIVAWSDSRTGVGA